MSDKNSKDKYDIGCVPSNFWYHMIGEKILADGAGLFMRMKVKPDQDYLNEEGPIIVIGNHMSYLDPMIMSKLTRGRPVNFVTGEFVFRKHFWGHVFKLGGAIPKKQFTVDTVSVKAMMKVLKRKGSLLLFPEATRSVDGSTIKFDDGVAKMAKKQRCAIYIAHIHGSYFSMPRWSKVIRFGKIEAEFVRKLPASQVEQMSVEELQNYIMDGIKYNENDYARNKAIEYKARNLAKGMQNVAYICPKCKNEFTTRWNSKDGGDVLRCESCGNGVRVLKTGLLAPCKDGDIVYDDLHKWTSWEKEIVKDELNKGIRMELQAELFKPFDDFHFSKTGSGRVIIENNTITYKGTDCKAEEGIPYKKDKPFLKYRKKTLEGIEKPTEYAFDINSMKGLVAKYGKHFEVHDSKGELFRFKIDGQKVYKIQLIVQSIVHN